MGVLSAVEHTFNKTAMHTTSTGKQWSKSEGKGKEQREAKTGLSVLKTRVKSTRSVHLGIFLTSTNYFNHAVTVFSITHQCRYIFFEKKELFSCCCLLNPCNVVAQ